MTEWLEAVAAYWASGGWLLAPIAAVSFAIFAYGLRLRERLNRWTVSAQDAERRLDAWFSGATASPNFVDIMLGSREMIARQVGQVLRDARDGREARRLLHRVTDWAQGVVKRDLFILKALTAAAPLLGLLGTVTGMVGTFMAVSRHHADGAAMVAQGVSTALITTQFGLVAALPGVFGLLHLGRLRVRLHSALHAIGIMLYVAHEDHLTRIT